MKRRNGRSRSLYSGMHRIRRRPSTPAALTGRWDDGARPATPAGGLSGIAVTHPRAALDGGLVVSSVVLCALGVVMIYSTTAPLAIGSAIPPHFVRHLVGLGLAFGALLLALWIPLRWWQRSAFVLWSISVALLVATVAVGTAANGAKRWIVLPGIGFSLQPAEFAKWATCLAVTALLARRLPRTRNALVGALGLAAVPTGLLLLQPNLSSAVVLVMLVGLLLFVSGTPLRQLGALAGAGALGVAGFSLAHPYALARWKGFLAPWQHSHAEGFQLVQSFVAFGRGGSFGVGIGDGRQKLSYLPEAHTDFILSVVAEELGLAGVLLVLGAFSALLVAGLRVASRAETPFARLLACAMTGFIALPAAINAAVVMGLGPTTGFTLPFLSFGSNSLVFCGLSLGLLLRIAGSAGESEASIEPQRRRRRASAGASR